jgi:hypothetical protein
MDETDQQLFIQQIYQTEERLFVLADSKQNFVGKREQTNPVCIEFDRKTLLVVNYHKDVTKLNIEACYGSSCENQVVQFVDQNAQTCFM